MKTPLALKLALSLLAMAALIGCATSTKQKNLVRGNFPSKYKTPRDGNLYIGPNYVENGGLRFYPDHLDTCWLADGFDFHGYDVLYVEPTQAAVTVQTNQSAALAELKTAVPGYLSIWMGSKKIFVSVITNASQIKPGARVLKLQTTVVKFAGGRIPKPHKPMNETLATVLGVVLVVAVVAVVVVAIAASHGGGSFNGIGLGGGGSSASRSRPKYRIYGKMMDGEKIVFEFQAYRAGEYSDSLQSMMLDLTDFVSAAAGQYKLR